MIIWYGGPPISTATGGMRVWVEAMAITSVAVTGPDSAAEAYSTRGGRVGGAGGREVSELKDASFDM